MSDSAVASYLRAIRLDLGFSQKELADAMGLSLRQVNRWENSGSESVKADALFRAIDFLGGSLDHIRYLMCSQATVEDAERLAQQWLHGEQISTEPTEGDIVHVMELALQLRGDRPRLAQMVGIGRRLVQERAREQQGGEGEQ